MKDRWVYLIVGIVLALWLTIEVRRCDDKPIVLPPPTHTTHRDTIIINDTIQLPPTVIKAKAKVIYDTVRLSLPTHPFVAVLDTIDPVTYDTIGLQFHFPATTFLYDIRRKPIEKEIVTIKQFDTIKYSVPIERQTKFERYLSYIGLVAVGVGIGYVIGSK